MAIFHPLWWSECLAETKPQGMEGRKVDHFCITINSNKHANLPFQCQHEYKHSLANPKKTLIAPLKI